MKKKTLVIILLFLALACCIGLIITKFNNKNKYGDFINNDKTIPYSEITEDSVEVYGDGVTSEEKDVLQFFAGLGISGGIQKINTNAYSDVDPPEIVSKYGVEYYYLITTATYTYTAIFVDGELLTDYEEVNSN